MTSIRNVLAALVFALIAAPADAFDKHVIVALDISASTPLVTNRAFAARAAKAVDRYLADLETGDRFTLGYIGDYGLSSDLQPWEATLSRRTPPIKVRRSTEQLIAGLPSLVTGGRIDRAQSTNIVGYIELAGYSVDCAQVDTQFIILSDGIESSDRVDGLKLMNGEALLPAVADDRLQGCALVMLGVGQITQGATPMLTQRLVKAWADWAAAAGMTFTPKPGL
ncbi:MAG: hypothetical protein ACFB2Z_04180 [Maricaulaceae bacterium]